MRSTLQASMAAVAAAIAVLLAPVLPARADSPVVTIGQLEAEGFQVNVDRIGNVPIDQCVVISVRNPQDQTQLVRVNGRGDKDYLVPVVVRRTISVSLDCTG